MLVNINYPDVTLIRFQGAATTGRSQTTFTAALGANKGSATNSTAFTLAGVTTGVSAPFVTPKITPAGTKSILSYDRSSVGFVYFYSITGGFTDVRILRVKSDLTIAYSHIRLMQICNSLSMSGASLHCITPQQYIIYKLDETTLALSLSQASILPLSPSVSALSRFCALSDSEGLFADSTDPSKIGLRYFKLNSTGFEANRLARWTYSAVNVVRPTAEGCYVHGSLQNNSQVVPSVVHYLRDTIAKVAYAGQLKPSPAEGFGNPQQTLAVVDGVFFALETTKLFVQIVDQGNTLSDGSTVKLVRPKYNMNLPQLAGVSAVVILPGALDLSRFYIMTYTNGPGATTGTFTPVAVTPLMMTCTNVKFEDNQELSIDYYFTTGLGKNPTYRNESSLLMLVVNPDANYDYDKPHRTAALVILIIMSSVGGLVFGYFAYLQIQEMRESAKVANASAGSIQELAPINHMPPSANVTNNMLTLHG